MSITSIFHIILKFLQEQKSKKRKEYNKNYRHMYVVEREDYVSHHHRQCILSPRQGITFTKIEQAPIFRSPFHDNRMELRHWRSIVMFSDDIFWKANAHATFCLSFQSYFIIFREDFHISISISTGKSFFYGLRKITR